MKVAEDGRLVVPLRDNEGHLWSLQFVGDTKTYLSGGRAKGLYHTIDPAGLLNESPRSGTAQTLLVCEDYATWADLHKATRLPVIVAFADTNLVQAAQSVRERFLDANILIAADNDHPLPQRGSGMRA